MFRLLARNSGKWKLRHPFLSVISGLCLQGEPRNRFCISTIGGYDRHSTGQLRDGVCPLPREGSEGGPDFVTQRYQDHYWRTTVKSVGKVEYHFYFQILDRHRQLKGYFQWDPFITIEDS
ncbi:AidA/PixA family protein [Streptomyces sp. NPDC008240]|uniref:AidA/PixA family protein n=1 Tax=Streptomyces sp. NPDC008240 TaxID=3364822 RepID=UPI0036E6A0CF